MGRRVDPIILDAITNLGAEDFRPALAYHFKVGGKRMRAAMVMLSCGASGGRMEDSLRPAAVVEMIHNYSLVMDDIIDRGDVRRGKPTIRSRFGNSISLLVAMLYREVLDDMIQEDPRKDVIRRIAVEAMKEIIEGEKLDLQFEQAGRDEPFLIDQRIRRPSFELYLKMIGKKTAALFRAAGEIGAHSAGGNALAVGALSSFGWNAGLAFQVMDDVLDICSTQTGKQQGKDIIEHKLGNAVILTAIEYLPLKDKNQILKILASPHVSLRQVAIARRLILKTPAESDCREVAKKYLQIAKGHLSGLKSTQHSIALAELGDEIVSRSF